MLNLVLIYTYFLSSLFQFGCILCLFLFIGFSNNMFMNIIYFILKINISLKVCIEDHTMCWVSALSLYIVNIFHALAKSAEMESCILFRFFLFIISYKWNAERIIYRFYSWNKLFIIKKCCSEFYFKWNNVITPLS